MAPHAKRRKIESIDLTGDSDEDHFERRRPLSGQHPEKNKVKYEPTTPPASSSQSNRWVKHEPSGPATSSSMSRRHAEHDLPTPPTSSAAVDVSSVLDDDDADAEVIGSQDFDDNVYQTLELYGKIQHKVVGVRFYNGRATTGEHVMLRREPSNQYDSNAIRCDNGDGIQVGHIPRQLAAKLAPFLDRHQLFLEGMLTGPKGDFDMPLELKLFGSSDPIEQLALKEDMKNARLPTNELLVAERARVQAEKEKATAEKERMKRQQQERKKQLQQAASRAGGVRGTADLQIEGDYKGFANLTMPSDDPTASSEPTMDDILESTTSFNPRELSDVVNKYGQSEDELAALPKMEQPARIATNLLPYQRQGLAWMLDRENTELPKPGSKDIVQLWQSTQGGYRNIATNYTTSAPKLASGGILADDMGLGKTLQIISLIVADPKATDKPTLIISPLSVMSNWSGQVEAHVSPERKLRVLIYHGPTRNQSPRDLCQYDIVISTYETMALEYMPAGVKGKPQQIPRSKGLYSIEWRRVVLDEGHACRNPSTKKAQAAYALLAQSRWALTGTPIVNNLKDLFSLVKFLRLSGGLQQQEVFSSVLIRPLSQGNAEAAILLKALMSTICLRRMKDMSFIDLKLPKLSQHKYAVEWLPHEGQKYDAFAAEAKGALPDYKTRKNAKGENTYSILLEVLLRMRQTCNHWKLCGERVANLRSIMESNKKLDLNRENTKKLQALLQLSIDSQEECPICFDILHDPCITACGHFFGGGCIERVIETQHKCPMCRAHLASKEELVQPAAPLGDSSTIDIDTSSSKVEALLKILRASQQKPGTKTVVFSQWTSFLDVIEHQLKENGIEFCRIDGKMNAARRDDAMARLASDPSCTVMLASLAVCSVGLNLVAANQVILADSWWAPAIEDQAVDRVYRLGQTKDVNVFRLVMEKSIEEKVLESQQTKRKLMMQAFGEKSVKRGNEKATRLQDLEKLLS